MKTYVPSGAVGGGSLPAMLAWVVGGVLVTALAVGALNHYVIDLVLVVPLVVGLGAGVGARQGVKAAHCRSLALATALGFAAGALGYVGKAYVHYRFERRATVAAFAAELAKPADGDEPADGGRSSIDPDRLFDALLAKEHGRGGFAGWVSQLVANGVAISKPGQSSGGLNLGSWGTVILLLVELGIAAFVAVAMARSRAEEPYCERCHRWLDETWQRLTTVEALKGVVDGLGGLDQGGAVPEGLLAALPPGPSDGQRAKVVVRQCPGCEEGFLFGSLVVPGENKQPVEQAVFTAVQAPAHALRIMLRGASS